MVPVYAVIALGARRELISSLAADLAGQVRELLVVDNRPDLAQPVLTGHARWIANARPGVHEAFNLGLQTARRLALVSGAQRWAALVLNDDVRVGAGAVARLVEPLEHDPSVWATYPDLRGLTSARQPVLVTSDLEITGRSHTGWCVCHRGESGIRYDERYRFWFGDDQLELDIRALGGQVAAVHGVVVVHLRPDGAVTGSPAVRALVTGDRRRFADRNPDVGLTRDRPALPAVKPPQRLV